MKTEVKVKGIFVHGRTRYEPGMANPTFTQGDARDLAKGGLVEIVGAATGDDADDLLGDSKAAPEVETKMERAPLNKSKK